MAKQKGKGTTGAPKSQKGNKSDLQLTMQNFDSAKLLELVKKFEARKILVLGDLGVDRYTIGQVDRISPEAPVPIVWVQEEKYKLGLAANVAENISILNGNAVLMGVIGDDSVGSDFVALLKKYKIPSNWVVTDGDRRTVLKDRIVSDRQQMLRVDYETKGYISPRSQNKILDHVRKQLGQCDAVLLEDYAKGLLTQSLVRSVIESARFAKKPIGVDPNAKSNIQLYKGCTFLTPNTKEAEALSEKKIINMKSLHEAGWKLVEETESEFVIITRGPEGMAIFDRDKGRVSYLPTYAKEVYDVSGAGDTVISILTLALSSGGSVEESALLGNIGAGVVVGKRGTATVNPAEIKSAIKEWSLRR